MAIPGNFLSQVTESVDPNTSGWVALLNATISPGVGGRNGDGCLTVTSVAAGEMRARTVTSYPVVPGTLYETFADASGSVPERIGLRWLDAANTELSITWSVPVSAASASWHRIIVGGVAPAGAARAQTVLSSTPASAGVNSFFENVYLGFPIRTTGNALPWNTESPEVDLSGWTVDSNCTLTRQTPAVTWPVDYYLAGGHVLTATVTAAGNAAIRTAAPAAAAAGVEYVGFCHLSPPTSTANAWIELRFVDDSQTVLQAVRSPLAAPGTGYYRQIASGPAPAGTTGVLVAVGITGASAGQILRADNVVVADRVTAEATGLLGALPTGSIVPFADASFEQGVAGWHVVSGPATLARSTPWGAMALHNSYSLLISSASAATSVIASGIFPMRGGGGADWVSGYSMQVLAGGWTLTRSVHWYDAAGTSIRTDSTGAATLPSPDWWNLTASGPAPDNAAQVAIEWTLQATAAASQVAVDTVWARQQPEAVQATVNAATASVSVAFRQVLSGDTLTIWRVQDDGTRTLVRGATGLVNGVPRTSDSYLFDDYEAPLGVPVSYLYEARDSAGKVVATGQTDTVTVPYDDINHGWLKDPGNPQRNLKILIVGDPPSFSRPIDQASYVVKNRRNKVTYSGIRNGNEGNLTISTPTDDDRQAVGWILDSGNTLLLQTAPGTGIGNMYVTVGQLDQSRAGQNADDPWRTWTLPLTETDMPVTTGVNGSAGRTWQDILSSFDTWQDVLDTYATWEDVLLDNRRK